MEQVIVVGGGPTGLWAACELRRAGLPVLLLERRTERSPHSKALTLHPRTIEVFAMRGLEGPFLDEGIKLPTGHFGGLEHRLDFRPLDTPYPFTLLYPQAGTEEILERHALDLGVRIRRGHAVTGLRQDEASVGLEVSGPDGDYAERAEYVVGCDGTGSTVRRAAGIAFPGSDATIVGYLGDVRLDAPPPPGFFRHGAEGTVMAVPLPGGLHRFVGVDPAGQDVAGTDLTFGEFRETVTRVAGEDFGMRDPVWLSRFGNATRQAAEYRRGRVLLAGDAAHMHFPTGGVGLNVGVQDAMNLAWKLAARIRGQAPDGLLDTYHTERHPVGAALLESSLAQTALLAGFSPAGRGLRSLLCRLVADHPELSLDLARRLSALDVAYPSTGPSAHPLTGTRTPDLYLAGDPEARVYDLLRTGRPLLLDLSGTAPAGAGLAGGALEAAGPRARALGIEVRSGTLTGAPRPGWSTAGAVLIRPDGHVWWAGDQPSDAALGTTALEALSTLYPAPLPGAA
ncbi:2-polyprenyl-6-methoxyphenol hydroxylase-like FAD-dependent oxidoreductase [Streptosporangium becharense]|uniref:2-polyprenyl-6-methoxyphenol hydroxylase-like FAD-dependent oxidoreductase n=1 Tax=Streptosporangium becharense TaxID=1816182 RepID=A0A7W9IJQ8_9ACTN|nr:FAD-dependent monooxygenase [Streptosporangium becharense]MBB2911076.1 2-polyprenyl-6-methoxyphenol hydroxylase-like FAD-dependent oxidoreductase [Streptosporangium becharense]MBB5821866.1 2-polyprenyl-6-methoxyphenol hydroxylase-like FAD-dependent oxidoreductase [Streptosporangium becharense]